MVKTKSTIAVSEAVRQALKRARPVVALESAIISFGLPRPENVRTALECERIVKGEGAQPATIGIIEGRIRIGLGAEEIRALATRRDVVKVNLSNMAAVSAKGLWGATSVSATLAAAHMAGIEVLATGGIGGVHRGFAETHDVSADLTALTRYRGIVVCSGAKAILDVGATIERLETLGIPIIGFQTERFPLFYTRGSPFAVDARADTEEEIAEIYRAHCRIPAMGAVLAVVPIPADYEISARVIERALRKVESGMRGADVSGRPASPSGRDVTPALLAALERETGGASVRANRALIRNNVRIAARIAKVIAE